MKKFLVFFIMVLMPSFLIAESKADLKEIINLIEDELMYTSNEAIYWEQRAKVAEDSIKNLSVRVRNLEYELQSVRDSINSLQDSLESLEKETLKNREFNYYLYLKMARR